MAALTSLTFSIVNFVVTKRKEAERFDTSLSPQRDFSREQVRKGGGSYKVTTRCIIDFELAAVASIRSTLYTPQPRSNSLVQLYDTQRHLVGHRWFWLT